MSTVTVEVAIGELADKISILQIKASKMTRPDQLQNVKTELTALTQAWSTHVTSNAALDALLETLRSVNERLWNIEDDIRQHEAAQDFGATFVALARSVYIENDHRARLKREINELTGSRIQEEKSYASYERS